MRNKFNSHGFSCDVDFWYKEDSCIIRFLDEKYFTEDMTEDILAFLEENLPECKNIYLPYHIDFVSVSDYDEYNGEY